MLNDMSLILTIINYYNIIFELNNLQKTYYFILIN